MEDEKIVEMYLLRNQEAVGASKEKYGRMLFGLSQTFLQSREDSEECENDTYLTAWNRIPPDKPLFLGAYLSKIIRYLSLNLLRKRNAGKRPETSLVLEELEECIPSSETVEGVVERGLLREVIERFLVTLTVESRTVFIRRYFYVESVRKIAFELGFTEGKVKTLLFRARGQLKALLEKEGLL